jgi:hypothetical protein
LLYRLSKLSRKRVEHTKSRDQEPIDYNSMDYDSESLVEETDRRQYWDSDADDEADNDNDSDNSSVHRESLYV